MSLCRSNKMSFPSKGEARAYLRELRRDRRNDRAGNGRPMSRHIRPYKCEHGRVEHWHLTSESKTESRRKGR